MIVIPPSTIRSPVPNNDAATIIWPTKTNGRFETRSAITPPIGPKITMEAPNPNATNPTALFVPSSSKATTACTVNDIMNASIENMEPVQRMR